MASPASHYLLLVNGYADGAAQFTELAAFFLAAGDVPFAFRFTVTSQTTLLVVFGQD